ncbi:uncharacterized protein EAF01_005750 [Botrytis porri]|uniref:Uncharacterized protein n=1 Tax=Botrytis porri TaxID=87229 RepID=A0A4Z1KHM7_9HELO|nr:uncharacterized protein EAF01_005750 [Botrytis porri]KAF7905229.1 hypothetical protein EAF01_005750 [Botrytis porri]TGO85030.1 hypothetical protein BPOR_0438g00010 [Botrytis porri]
MNLTSGNTSGNRGSEGGQSSNLESNPTAEQAGGQWQCQMPLPFPLAMFSCDHWNKPNVITCEAPERNPFNDVHLKNPGRDLGCGRQRVDGFWRLGTHVNRLNLFYRKIEQIPDLGWVVLKDGRRVNGRDER